MCENPKLNGALNNVFDRVVDLMIQKAANYGLSWFANGQGDNSGGLIIPQSTWFPAGEASSYSSTALTSPLEEDLLKKVHDQIILELSGIISEHFRILNSIFESDSPLPEQFLRNYFQVNPFVYSRLYFRIRSQVESDMFENTRETVAERGKRLYQQFMDTEPSSSSDKYPTLPPFSEEDSQEYYERVECKEDEKGKEPVRYRKVPTFRLF